MEEREALLRERADELQQLVGILLERLPSSHLLRRRVRGRTGLPWSRSSIRNRRCAGRRWWRGGSTRCGGCEISPRGCRGGLGDWHTRAAGMDVYRDERLWYLGRMRLNPPGLASLADLIAPWRLIGGWPARSRVGRPG